jgi:ABC-type proline/glycine betaine transport system ATPase subunit
LASRSGEIFWAARLQIANASSSEVAALALMQVCVIIIPLALLGLLLLLDEPMSSLDADLKAELLAELKSLQRALGVTTVYITHDRAEAAAIAQRIVAVSNGRIAQVQR